MTRQWIIRRTENPCHKCNGECFVPSWPNKIRCDSCNGRGWQIDEEILDFKEV